MGGTSWFWDGYDNQPIVMIDGPGLFDPCFQKDDIVAFKKVFSSKNHIVEVKRNSMQFDSHLVIIIADHNPEDMAQSAGLERDPVYW